MLRHARVAAITLLAGLSLTGCATGPIRPVYVPPTQYQTLNCEQLRLEYNRLARYIATGVEAPAAQGIGVGLGLGGWLGRGGGLWPSISVDMSQQQNSQRTVYARLLGEQDAIAQAAAFKGCPLQPVAPVPQR